MLYTVPLGVPDGFKGKLILRGLKLDAVDGVTTPLAGAAVKRAGDGKKQNPPQNVPPRLGGDTAVEVELELPKPVPGNPAGPRFVWLKLAPKGGKSAAGFARIRIDPPGTLAEKEPNNALAGAAPLVSNVTV